jgi:integrase
MARVRDHLHRRENGIFAFSYKDVTTGEWKEKYCGTTDRRQAKLVRERFLVELAAGILPTDMSSWRLTEAAEWWNEFRQPRISKASRGSEPYRLQHLPRIIGNKRLKEITNQDLDRYTTARLAVPVGAWSINRELQIWSLILRKAKLWHRLAEDYRPLKTKASDIGQALTREQLRHLSEVAETNREWEAAFYGSVLAANTGLRGGEIKRLKVGSIDLQHRRIKILRSNAKSDASARFVET